MKKQSPRTEGGQSLHIMSDEENRRMLRHFPDPIITLYLEDCISHRQSLVNDQDIRADTDRQGKGQAHEHPGGIIPDRLIDEISDIREFEDPGEQLLRLPQAPAHQRKVQTDIFPAGPVRLKAGPEFQQRGYGPLQPDGAGARTGNSGKQLQKRGFSGSVPADDPHAFPSADPE